MCGTMIFNEFGVTPQIPSVAAVRIVLARLTRDEYCAEGVTKSDEREFDFCVANSVVFVFNAMECAKEVLRAQLSSRPSREALDRFIGSKLKEMCLARVPTGGDGRFGARNQLRKQLRAEPWDRELAASELVQVLNLLQLPVEAL